MSTDESRKKVRAYKNVIEMHVYYEKTVHGYLWFCTK